MEQHSVPNRTSSTVASILPGVGAGDTRRGTYLGRHSTLEHVTCTWTGPEHRTAGVEMSTGETEIVVA